MRGKGLVLRSWDRRGGVGCNKQSHAIIFCTTYSLKGGERLLDFSSPRLSSRSAWLGGHDGNPAAWFLRAAFSFTGCVRVQVNGLRSFEPKHKFCSELLKPTVVRSCPCVPRWFSVPFFQRVDVLLYRRNGATMTTCVCVSRMMRCSCRSWLGSCFNFGVFVLRLHGRRGVKATCGLQ